ncbi:RNA-directed DNA polymerase, eukaryota, reverse transcriptase zinc-binding domain protein [Tanacetum coccineum]
MNKLELFHYKSIWGNYSFDYACSMACGRSRVLISLWDPNMFAKDDIWYDDAFVIVKAKAILWNRIADFMQHHSGHFVIFSYLNEVRFDFELRGFNFSQPNANTFNTFITNNGLIELPMGSRLFTWMNKAGTKLSKLDRFLFSKNAIEALPDAQVTTLDRLWSDHNPILLHCNKSDYGPTPFRLYHS